LLSNLCSRIFGATRELRPRALGATPVRKNPEEANAPMAASKRIIKKAARKLEQGGDCASLGGSIMGSRAAQKRKTTREKAARKKARTQGGWAPQIRS